MTFSIAARCAQSGVFGIAVASSSPAVAARCAYAQAKVGAASSQNITDPTLGPRALELLALGASAAQARDAVVQSTKHIDYRQLTIVDRAGGTAVFSGGKTLGVHATAEAPNAVAAGNLLDNTGVPAAIVTAFEAATGPLGDRLISAMAAGLAAGGEAGPIRSAGMLLVDEVTWPVADLRVDWDETDPIAALDRLWRLYQPQLADYVTRAIDPSKAPSYGVPGDR